MYFNLVDATTYKEFEDGQSFEKKAAFAKVINEIGLFGDIATITVAEELAQKLKNSEETEEWVSYEPLLRALRDQLRDELGLTRTSKILMMHVKQIQPSEVETKPKHDEP